MSRNCGAKSRSAAARMAAIGAARMSGGGIEIEWRDAGLVGEKGRQLGRLIGRPVPYHVVAALARP